MANRPAKCGTKGGFNRHKRTLKDEPCQACRDAENAARRVLRKSPPLKRFCPCGRETRTEHDLCGPCRRSKQVLKCKECGKTARSGNTLCASCVIAAALDFERPVGWIRTKPGGPLVGVQTPHNHPDRCTAHAVCDQRQREEEAA